MPKHQAEIWREIVAARPADWFGQDTADLLEEYCRTVAVVRHLGAHIDTFQRKKTIDSDAMRAYKTALSAYREQLKAMKMLATTMRLTQQSRYTPQAAATATKRAGAAKKPWEE